MTWYTDQAAFHAKMQQTYKKRYNWNALLRLAVFITSLVALYFSFQTTVWGVAIVFTVAVIAFLILVQKSARLEYLKKWHTALLSINQNEQKSLQGNNEAFESGSEFMMSDHAFSYDLDLFGADGFFPTLNRTTRPGGKQRLAKWLMNPFLKEDEIKAQQQTFSELSHHLKWRQKFIAHGHINPLTEESDALIKKLSDYSFPTPKFLVNKLLRYGLPALTFTFIILSIFGLFPSGYWIIAVLLQWLFIGLAGRYFKKANAATGRTEKIMSTQAKLIEMIFEEQWKSKTLNDIRNTFIADVNAVQQIKSLAAILKSMEYRNNLVVGFIANSVLLWDIQCLARFGKWHRFNRQFLPKWINALDEMDAYISGANYVYNHPDFVFPEFTDQSLIEADNLGHPLLNDEKRITNDYLLEKSTSFHVITGANMAGKSTFLRTIALSSVMAMSGLPVCAKSFKFKPVKVFTSMRTTDSLSKDESYFYAELKRLKAAYDKIKEGEHILLILDEILKGTNSEDKRQGSMAFLKRLMQFEVSGIVATHDTQLGDLEKLFPDNVKNYCFEIEIDGQDVDFDYKLQRGITQTMNARLLMEQMGLT